MAVERNRQKLKTLSRLGKGVAARYIFQSISCVGMEEEDSIICLESENGARCIGNSYLDGSDRTTPVEER